MAEHDVTEHAMTTKPQNSNIEQSEPLTATHRHGHDCRWLSAVIDTADRVPLKGQFELRRYPLAPYFDKECTFLQTLVGGQLYSTERYGSTDLKCGVDDEKVLELAPDRDLEVDLDRRIKVRVYSLVLRLSFDVFRTMFKPSFQQEQLALDPSRLASASFRGVELNAMIFLLHILHHQFDSSEQLIRNKRNVLKLAMVANQYNLTTIVASWIGTIRQNLCYHGEQDPGIVFTVMNELDAAYFLNQPVRYDWATSYLMANLKMRYHEDARADTDDISGSLPPRRYPLLHLLGGDAAIGESDRATAQKTKQDQE